MPESAVNLEALTKLDEMKVQFHWSKDWWDGPMNGLATYEGSPCWFEFHSMDEEGVYFYLLYKLSPEQHGTVEAWHSANEKWRLIWMERFAKDDRSCTAEAREFAADWTRSVPDLRSPAAGPPLGWFSSGRNSSYYGVQITKPA
jgi:hypothetical protein